MDPEGGHQISKLVILPYLTIFVASKDFI